MAVWQHPDKADPARPVGIEGDGGREPHALAHVVEAVERERARVGRELHDGLASHLAGVSMRLQALADAAARGEAVSAGDLEGAATLVAQASEQIRRIAHGLSAIHVDHGLPDALRALAGDLTLVWGIPAHFEQEGGVPDLPRAVRHHLYSIAREAAANAARHAAATRITLTLSHRGAHLVLQVEDDGTGLPVPAPDHGLGLPSMGYRAHRIGATLRFERPPRGTRVVCLLPLSVPPREAPP